MANIINLSKDIEKIIKKKLGAFAKFDSMKVIIIGHIDYLELSIENIELFTKHFIEFKVVGRNPKDLKKALCETLDKICEEYLDGD